ncbi:MAG: hypothetical protein AAF416_16275 [Pseudomonadota bacterium]
MGDYVVEYLPFDAAEQEALAGFLALGREEDGLRKAAAGDGHRCYRLLLGREPEPGGVAAAEATVARGIPLKALQRSFLDSPEFYEEIPRDRHEGVIAAWYAAHGPYASWRWGIRWFHCLALPDGVTDGMRPVAHLRAEGEAVFAPMAPGGRVLDIGAWDGFFSFEAERRGAAEVLATDHFCWSGPGWGTKAGFDTAHRALGSHVTSEDVDVFDLSPERQGMFDTVLFLGVLYHLTDPYGGLARAAAMTRDLLVVDTVTACNHIDEPVMRHYEGDSLDRDATNMFAPNTACLASILRELGFSRIEVQRNPACAEPPPKLTWSASSRDRHMVHAWR